jgi:pimeloyl-ACP methyl ester carboxylesterase
VFWFVLVPLTAGVLATAAFMAYIWIRYAPIIVRIFEETPVFAPLRVVPEEGGESLRIPTEDGFELAASYFPAETAQRAGVVVFCPEYLGDRWSFQPYCDGLREAGFDVLSFDFRNHGDSGVDRSYNPLQWVSDIEVLDLRAVLRYLRSRPDRDPAGVALFGVSRGGGAALCLAAQDPTVWAVVTDGAFPTRGTMLSYVLRWAEIPVRWKPMLKLMPRWMYAFAAWTGRYTAQRRSGRSYPNLERAAARIAPRPWLMIHGERDVYIGPDIAMGLFAHAGDPKRAWIVPGAKHNRCREADPDQYRVNLLRFLAEAAPRRVPPVRRADILSDVVAERYNGNGHLSVGALDDGVVVK